jgi:hypothetical protein
MVLDPELESMNKIHAALKDLEDDAKQRVIDWAIGKFSLRGQKPSGGAKHSQSLGAGENIVDIGAFESAADISAKAKPQSEADKVLVVAAYLQNKGGEKELTSREINKELKNLGHGVGNITNAISSLSVKKPSLMIQTRKEGRSKQAQKKYKVTTEGFEAVKRLISQAVDA